MNACRACPPVWLRNLVTLNKTGKAALRLLYKPSDKRTKHQLEDHATLERVYGRLGNTSIFETQAKASSSWSGDYYRADKEIISSLVLWRPVGRVHSR